MLEVRDIHKSYTTGDFTQLALDGVSLAFRRNEFVAILGPSGSGKTTLLNIVGGLDAYDGGELRIDGVATSRFTDRDWDTYRNDRIGFVFQSYNLIPHQSVLANVELALTLSGVSKAQRRSQAMAALESVGLAEHAHKRPSQLSGGQMQRVAIARALINDPEILLADEPTGALDSTTSAQIMALLSEIARDRLVIMVTHNPDLAKQYANRTITLTDGLVVTDTNPHEQPQGERAAQGTRRRTRMGSLTAVGLSLANLLTKRGRTAMTAFAGSIGIIGIAAILALANGVNDYIRTVEEDTLSVYPLTIQGQGVDMSMFIAAGTEVAQQATTTHDDGRIHEVQILSRMLSSIGANDLGSLKEFIDDGAIADEVSSVHYSYDVAPHIYSPNPDGTYDLVNPARLSGTAASGMGRSMQPVVFEELLSDTEVVQNQYDVLSGRWPEGPTELLVVLTPSGDVSDFTLYAMGLRDRAERDEMMRAMAEGGAPKPVGEPLSFTPAELMDATFELAHAADYYVYDEDFDVWVDRRGEQDFLQGLLGHTPLRIVGVVQPKDGASATALRPGIYYSPELTGEVISHAAQAEIVAQQKRDRTTDVFTGRPFSEGGATFAREDFDIASLLSIDSDAIADAFSIDPSQMPALNLGAGALELPDLEIPPVTIDPSDLPPLDLEEVLTGIEVEVDEDEVAGALEEFTQGYVQFALDEGLDPSDIEATLPLFLESEAAAEVIEEVSEITEPLQEQMQNHLQAELADYLQRAMSSVMAGAMSQIAPSVQGQLFDSLQEQMGSITGQIEASMAELPNILSVDEEAFAAAFEFNVDEDELTELMLAMVLEEERTADANLRALGYAEYDTPANIDIYPLNFEAKAEIIAVLDQYNERMEGAGDEGKVVTYTDIVGTLMSSVTDILNVITYVLVAFVAISLVVSSIMIGVITYISVLERRKEIGILRAIGASKRDIRRVFNAETLIIGFLAGALGIAITFLLTLPANAIVNSRFGIEKVAVLPPVAALVLVTISMGLTFLAGLLPASSAARKDPVEALRSE